MSEDILERIKDWADEHKALPLGMFLTEIKRELERLQAENIILRERVGEENRANRMTALYKTVVWDNERLRVEADSWRNVAGIMHEFLREGNPLAAMTHYEGECKEWSRD